MFKCRGLYLVSCIQVEFDNRGSVIEHQIEAS